MKCSRGAIVLNEYGLPVTWILEPLTFRSAHHVERAIRLTEREPAMNASRCT